MYGKGSKKGLVRFALAPGDSAGKVQLVGDFNDWTPAVMRKQKSGQYVAQVPLDAGTYEYKYIVDGEWIVDPDHGVLALNPFGTFNSVAEVG